MDRARDWIYRFVHCRACGCCMVHELGAKSRLCSVCDLSDRARHRIGDSFAASHHLRSASMEPTEAIFPDLQSCVLCEDVRCEFNGMNTLVGVLNVIAAPSLPINYMRLCIWTRWCSGTGRFKQRSRIVGVDEQNVLAQAEVEFELKEMEGHATNVHYFGGVQFQQFGLHHVEIYLHDELRLRFPLPVVRLASKQ